MSEAEWNTPRVRENVISGRLNCLFQTLYPLEAGGNLTSAVDMIRVLDVIFWAGYWARDEGDDIWNEPVSWPLKL